jgi:glutathione S-transferase
MKLYTHPFSPNGRKVVGVATHAGLALDLQIVDLRAGEQKKPDFLALNPNGKVPVLVDGDSILWESNAIACSVASKADSDLWPKSNQRYDILRWAFWETNHWSKAIFLLISQHIFNSDNPDQAIIDKGLDEFRTYAAVLDGHLKGRGTLSGDDLTIADFVVGVWLGFKEVCQMPVSEFPEIERWYGGLTALPAWSEMLPPRP